MSSRRSLATSRTRVRTVAEQIQHYVPTTCTEHWHQVGPFVRQVVTSYQPNGVGQARTAMGDVNAFAHWALDHGLDLDVESLFTPDVVEHYVAAGMPGKQEHSRSTVRGRLIRIGRTVTRRAPWPPAKTQRPRPRLAPPYTPAEVNRLWQTAGKQPTKAKTRAMDAVLSVGLGAGLTTVEHTLITGTDVRVHGEAAVIDIPGRRARTVPVRSRYAAKVLELARQHPDTVLFNNSTVGAKNSVHNALARLVLPSGVPAVNCARLRTTWAVELLAAGVPVKEFMAAYGIATTYTLADLLPHLPDADPDVVLRLMTQAGGDQR